MTRTVLIAGNWKMNGLRDSAEWGEALARAVASAPSCDVAVCPPATLLQAVGAALPDFAVLGGQDCSSEAPGAHTGDIAAAMLADLGCRYVIVGHSERRTGHHEDDALVKAKAKAALEAGLTPILCVGETLAERETGQAEQVVIGQLTASLPDGVQARDIVIAYEPIWAIGTGKTATPEHAQAMHAQIRKAWPGADADALRMLYGGSVKPDNAADLLAQPDIDGALVGGASLDPSDFAEIIAAAR